jgi:hypothetical protein
MDLRAYYQKLRQIESSISEPFVVIVSQATPDGGTAGVGIEVSRAVAAKMVLERCARLATEQESTSFRAKVAEAKRLADQAAAVSRLQVTVVSEAGTKKTSNQPKVLKS